MKLKINDRIPIILAALCMACGGALVVLSGRQAAAEPAEPILTPVEARAKINQQVRVEMVVRACKNALAKRMEIYLDSELDFRDDKNLAVVITKTGADLFAQAAIPDPAEHFKNRRIRVRGTVKLHEDRLRIEVNEPQQIELVPPTP